jgi:hypothetical protein
MSEPGRVHVDAPSGVTRPRHAPVGSQWATNGGASSPLQLSTSTTHRVSVGHDFEPTVAQSPDTTSAPAPYVRETLPRPSVVCAKSAVLAAPLIVSSLGPPSTRRADTIQRRWQADRALGWLKSPSPAMVGLRPHHGPAPRNPVIQSASTDRDPLQGPPP